MFSSLLVFMMLAPSWTTVEPQDILTRVEVITSRGCGSRGGPGFRGPDGKCVGWANLTKVCGSPPTVRCTHEGGGVGDTTLQAGAAFIAGTGGTSTAATNFNHRTIQRDALACASQTSLARIAPCAVGTEEASCKAQLGAAIAKGECVMLRAGTDASIEAGSHSFQWLRVRPQNENRGFWVERRHVLD